MGLFLVGVFPFALARGHESGFEPSETWRMAPLMASLNIVVGVDAGGVCWAGQN